MNATSSCTHVSEIRVITGLVASFAKPFPFLQSSRLHFDCGLLGCSSISSFGVGVSAIMGADDGAACGDGEHRMEGEAVGCPLLSSSHVEVVISSRRQRAWGKRYFKILLDDGPKLLSALEGVKPFP